MLSEVGPSLTSGYVSFIPVAIIVGIVLYALCCALFPDWNNEPEEKQRRRILIALIAFICCTVLVTILVYHIRWVDYNRSVPKKSG